VALHGRIDRECAGQIAREEPELLGAKHGASAMDFFRIAVISRPVFLKRIIPAAF
jgi:hypothetical protein